MKIRLRIFTDTSHSLGKYYRFAVVDLDKSANYPANFLCLLPTFTNGEVKHESKFCDLFGSNSVKKAESLLVLALRNEDDYEVKAEIDKRLSGLNPEKYIQTRCRSCGKQFYARKKGSFVCKKCLKNENRFLA